jgi:hypothetical protein
MFPHHGLMQKHKVAEHSYEEGNQVGIKPGFCKLNLSAGVGITRSLCTWHFSKLQSTDQVWKFCPYEFCSSARRLASSRRVVVCFFLSFLTGIST